MADVNRMSVLEQMREEGRISEEEYEGLKEGLVDRAPQASEPTIAETPDVPVTAPPPNPKPPSLADQGLVPEGEVLEEESGLEFIDDPTATDDGSDDVNDTADEDTEADDHSPLQVLDPRTDLSPGFYAIIFGVIALMLIGSGIGVVNWLVTIATIVGLGATLFHGSTKVTIGAGVAVVLIAVLGAFFGGPTPTPDRPAAGTLPPVTTPEATDQSLGVLFPDLREQWNQVESDASIRGGLTVNAETGQFDSFIYRFDEWGRLAGAYDPDDDAVYALLATGQFSRDDTQQLYLHLCFVTNPFSQDCIQSYFEHGLDGGELADFNDLTHQAEWELGSQTWDLEIEGNVLTIRVFGPGAQ